MLLMNSGGNSAALSKVYVDDVFTSYTRTGTGADSVVTTGIDMTKGYMLWSKGRSGATDHAIYDSARGFTFDLVSNSTAGQTTQVTGLKAVSSTGHTVGSLAKMNTSTATYVDWVFRNADKFFSHATVTKSAGSNATVSFPNLSTLGRVVVKRTDNTGSWYVWHRSLTAGKLLYLEQTAAEATLGHITVSGTTVTLVNSVIADGSYVVYAWSHDASPGGIIQCGSFTTDASGNATVTLGWEPQLVDIKSSSTADQWYRADSMRGMTADAVDNLLYLNQAWSESAGTMIAPKSTGFTVTGLAASSTYIYLAIRRPNKPPTIGTQVYKTSAPNESGSFPCVQTGWPVDFGIIKINKTTTGSNFSACRLVGELFMYTDTTAAESADSSFKWDSNIGWLNLSGANLVAHSFRRAPGFMDVVCYPGDGVSGRAIPHNLGVTPELIIAKCRGPAGTQSWAVQPNGDGTKLLYLDLTNAVNTGNAAFWNNTNPTSSVFTVGSAAIVNAAGQNYVAYLFASLPGISKVGSYTGNGSSQTINCGFTTGARFFLVKATSTTGNWWVFDSARGIVSSFDPSLALNTTNAEVTSADAVDPDPSGIIVNQVAATNINVNATQYLYLAIA